MRKRDEGEDERALRQGDELPINIGGTEVFSSDTRERYRQKLARITLDSMVQFVGLLDTKGTVVEINQVALHAVRIKLSDVEGTPFWTTFWWQVSEEIRAELKESVRRAAQGEFVRWDTEIYGRAGGKETIIIDASLCPVKDTQGNVVFITAEGRDITEKKAHEREIARQREELAKLDELKTQFFANISHEFRTPLTLLIGPFEHVLAQQDGLSPATREHLELSHRNSLRLLKLLNTLLDFSRVEAGRMQASYEPTDIALLTTELARSFRSDGTEPMSEALTDRPQARREKISARRILLADDDADMRNYVRRLLVQNDYEVEAVADGHGALAAARRRKPDLVLTDVMTAGRDGFALLRELRMDAKLAAVPIILLSARAGEEAQVEGMDAGADDYLIKPFSGRELLARIESNLNMARFRHGMAEAEQAVARLTAESEQRRRL